MDKYGQLMIDSKKTINKWEQEFYKDHARKPSKEDFKSAPQTVVDAYKTYYKIKKKLEEQQQQDQDKSVAVSHDDLPPEPQHEQQNDEPTKKDATPPEDLSSAWGDHLNKPKAVQDAAKAPASKSSPSSVPANYSKLTEKLMKGAKINIRSSLTRRPSRANHTVQSPAEEKPVEPHSKSHSSSFMVNGDSQIDLSCSSEGTENTPKVTGTPSAPPPLPEPDDEEVIQGFKPKIVQQKGRVKVNPSYVLRGIQADETQQRPLLLQTPGRSVDLEWLEGCLTEGKTAPIQPAVENDEPEDHPPKQPVHETPMDDEDILDPSDDEGATQTARPARSVGRKRKDPSEEEQENAITGALPKRPRTEPGILPDDPIPLSTPSAVPSRISAVPDVAELSSITAKKERLAKKMASGTANQNFVRVNLKKKVFARGKKAMTGSSYKRQQWKERQGITGRRGGRGGNYKATTACRRCGEIGHWAKFCQSDKLMSLENLKETGEDEDLQFPTLEEALDKAAEGQQEPPGRQKKARKEAVVGEGEEEADLQLVEVPSVQSVEPFCSPGDPVPDSVRQLLAKFGHSEFRAGQEEAIMRILSGRSTLVVQSTGAGKSLIYQLPAVLFAQRSKALTIVVSPLVSLMEDQVANMPAFVKGACLHSGQSKTIRDKTLAALESGSVYILLVSPESVVSAGPTGLASILKSGRTPPVAFVCLDEAHCVSQWSHNFRPSYLRVCKVLREKMNIRTILGLTATAPRSTLKSIAENLGVDTSEGSSNGVIRGILLPPNLQLSVSRDADRDAALVHLLSADGRFESYQSVIVYCIRREECERLAVLLRTCLKDPVRDLPAGGSKGSKARKGVSWSAEAYHAGLTSARRTAVQKQFMSGQLRVVVATVAFGMGINKSDIRAIIHYNAPKNFENYVQEIGRAGRDGLPASCHVFLNSEGRDLQELRRFIYANSTDRHILRKLVRKILPAETCRCSPGCCQGHEVAMPVDTTVQELDMPEENIATLLCHLESHPAGWIKEVGTKVYATCTVRSYAGIQQLKQAARECPPLGAALALQEEQPQPDGKIAASAVRTFSVVDVARRIGWDSGRVKRDLKQLEWDKSGLALGGKVRRSGLLVEFADLAFHLRVRGDLSEEERDAALEYLHQRCVQREANELQQLQRVHQALLSVSHANSTSAADQTRSDKLRGFIHDYFEEAQTDSGPSGLPSQETVPESHEAHIRADIRSLILSYRDQSFTARSIARILHGIASPSFPAEIWGKARRFWRAHLHHDFNTILRFATQELLALK